MTEKKTIPTAVNLETTHKVHSVEAEKENNVTSTTSACGLACFMLKIAQHVAFSDCFCWQRMN